MTEKTIKNHQNLPNKKGKYLNILLLFTQTAIVCAFIAIALSRSSFEALSASIHGENAPLMGSLWIDTIIKPSSAWAAAMLLLLILLKEFFLSRAARIKINLFSLLLLGVFFYFVLSLIYSSFTTPPI